VATYAGSSQTVSFYVKNGFCPVAVLPDVFGPKAEGMIYLRKLLR
jgi:hypothetical protein